MTGAGQDKVKYQRWNKDSDAAKFLVRALKSGEIDPNDSPKTVHERYIQFQPYKLDSFRQQFNKLKTEMGFNIRPRDTGGIQLDDADFECKYIAFLLFLYLFSNNFCRYG